MLTLVTGLVFAEHVIDDSKKPGYLFVISGSSGSLEGDTLTLNGVPNVVYFTDRPARKAGHMSVTKLIDIWQNGPESLKSDPPNAVLSILSENGNKNITVELQNPSAEGNIIKFKIKKLQGTAPKEFKESSLFIDPAENGMGGVLGG
jgi:hypothetical protein